jgi:predicted DNA-binding protein (MmcQ/YjbR family)
MNIEDLRELCLSLPYATEDVKYGSDLSFSIGKKIFCGTRITGSFRTGLKCNPDDFAILTEKQGILPMPRLSVTGWIRIENEYALNDKEWQEYVRKSYALIMDQLTKKEKQLLGLM